MINTAFPNLIKIGRTTKSSDERASELYTTGTPGKFIVVYDVLVDNCEEIEKELHHYYADKRYSNNREFFQVSTKDAIVKLQEISQGRLATFHSTEMVNSVDTELCDGNLVSVYFYHSKASFYNTGTSQVDWSESDTYTLHRFGIFQDESSNPENTLTSNLRKYYFEQQKLTHPVFGVKLVSITRINLFPINEKKRVAIDKLFSSSLENFTNTESFKEKFSFVDDNQTLTYKNGGEYDGYYELEETYNKVKNNLESYMEREQNAYLAWEEEAAKNELKKSWSGKI